MNCSEKGDIRYLIELRLARCDEMNRERLRLIAVEAEACSVASRCELLPEMPAGHICAKLKLAPPRSRRRFRLPEELRLPDDTPHPPNLSAACLSFAARVVIAVRDRFGGDAPSVYRAAGITRQAYSQIVSDETHRVDKKTALRFAFALRLTLEEAGNLLKSAGFAFSNANRRDCVLQACLEANPPVWNLADVNLLLREYRVDFQF